MSEVVPSATTTAFLDWGRWIAECPFCRGALAVTYGERTYHCTPPAGCNGRAAILWPAKSGEVDKAIGGGVVDPFQATDPAKGWHEGQKVPR